MSRLEDKRLTLPGGRTLAYADTGNTASSTLVLFFHGAFGIGDASKPSPVLLEKNIHYVAPTLPGWGSSSPIIPATSYASVLAGDITALITHLHPDMHDLKLYIGGGSFGTVPAQILYGAPYDVFPLGRHIAALLLVAPLSPPHCHKNYTRHLSWENYFMIGPPPHFVPFNLIPRLAKYLVQGKIKTAEAAEAFIRTTFFDQMDESELDAFARWRDIHEFEEGQAERWMADGVVRSVAKTWAGFLDIPDILHSGWGGFCPETLDDEHSDPPVLVVTSTRETLAPKPMADWLVASYKNVSMKLIDGGHIASLFHLNEIWKEFLELGRHPKQ
jgi:pimeloyl-ACP methyl ester carboxylesterase